MTPQTLADPAAAPSLGIGSDASRTSGTPVPAVNRGTVGGLRKSRWEQFALGLFVIVPFLAVIAAVPFLWGWGLGWHDVLIAVVMYAISGHGITIGYHR